jgi:hypothetical protein
VKRSSKFREKESTLSSAILVNGRENENESDKLKTRDTLAHLSINKDLRKKGFKN